MLLADVDEMRTIPTRVGRTWRACGCVTCSPDHPHAGGENFGGDHRAPPRVGPSPRGWGERAGIGQSVRGGPSPRGWGELGQVGRSDGSFRTIPTRVGRTPPPPRTHQSCSDHPHAGGENATPRTHQSCSDHPHAGGENTHARSKSPCEVGPSPRGWGELRLRKADNLGARTIPTRVGRTRGWSGTRGSPTDHPHAGGENECEGVACVLESGPSPRGWGEQRHVSRPPRRSRTIPTRVGRTQKPRGPPDTPPDHPHAGGENGIHHRNLSVITDHPHAGGENWDS